MLPSSSLDLQKARESPYMFVDTGVPLLFRMAYTLEAEKLRMIIRLAGDANLLSGDDYFSIGQRNFLAAREVLMRNGVHIMAEQVGGNVSRTVRLDISTGELLIRSPGQEDSVL